MLYATRGWLLHWCHLVRVVCYTRLAIALVSLSARCMYDSNSIIALDRRLSESQMRKHIIQLEQNNQRQKEIIQNLRNQLNAYDRKTISVRSDQVHDEDAVLITCKNLKRILKELSKLEFLLIAEIQCTWHLFYFTLVCF